MTNNEVMYRTAQEFLLNEFDYYIRVHLAPEDSSQNEAERYQSSIGEFLCCTYRKKENVYLLVL